MVLELGQDHVHCCALPLAGCDHQWRLSRLILLVGEDLLMRPERHGPLEDGRLVELSADVQDSVAALLENRLRIKAAFQPEHLLDLVDLASLNLVAEVVPLRQVLSLQVNFKTARLEDVLLVVLPVLIYWALV